MRLVNAWIGNQGKPIVTAKGNRYQVRWVISLGAGRVSRERKRTTFVAKAEARAFIERLHRAEFESDGWRFNESGEPTQESLVVTTVFAAVEAYVASRWHAVWRVGQRTKARMRLVELVALTVHPTRDSLALMVALDEQRPDRPRVQPNTEIEWAARYLRDYGLRPSSGALSTEFSVARRWIIAHSIPVTALSIGTVTDLRDHFTRASLAPKTARTYWSGIAMPFLTWLIDTDQVARSIVKAQPPLRRDVEDERPDPRRIPGPAQTEVVAVHFAERHGEEWGTFVRLSTCCALRISEALDVRWSSFIERRGRLYLRVTTQQRRVTAADTDDGVALVRTPTKSTRDRTPRAREIPLPLSLEAEVRELAGERLGRDGSLAFVGQRGATSPVDAVRRWWRDAVNEVLVPEAPHLAGITPHSMRHAGMTYWFAQGVDGKRVQLWGGWSSTVQMLDTYRGVLDELEQIDLAGIDQLEWGAEANTQTPTDQARIVDLGEWRSRRH